MNGSIAVAITLVPSFRFNLVLLDIALCFDDTHQFFPGLHEGFRALILKLSGKRRNIDAGFCKLRQKGFGVTSIRGQDTTHLSVVAKKAFNVFSGIVFTVNGAARALR